MQSFECGDFKEIEVSRRARGAHCTALWASFGVEMDKTPGGNFGHIVL